MYNSPFQQQQRPQSSASSFYSTNTTNNRRQDVAKSLLIHETSVPLPPLPPPSNNQQDKNDQDLNFQPPSSPVDVLKLDRSFDNGIPPIPPPKDDDYDYDNDYTNQKQSIYVPFQHTDTNDSNNNQNKSSSLLMQKSLLSNDNDNYQSYTQSYNNGNLITLDDLDSKQNFNNASLSSNFNSNNLVTNSNIYNNNPSSSSSSLLKQNSTSWDDQQLDYFDMNNNNTQEPPLPKLPPGAPVPTEKELAERERQIKVLSMHQQRHSMMANKGYNDIPLNGDLPPVPPPVTPYAESHPAPSRPPPTKLVKFWSLPLVVYVLSIVQTVVFIVEFIKMGVLTGSPIATQPSFNPMIGPSTYLLINMGARFTPCMHFIDGLTNDPSLKYPCPNSTTLDTNVCSLAELCGMSNTLHMEKLGSLDNTKRADPLDTNYSPDQPQQWWRFITPIFLHAGLVHLGFNLLLQIKLGGDIERSIGHIRFFIIYFVCGIGGFLLGGNFTPDGIASTGASGAIFGLIALDLLDLLFNWKTYKDPWKSLILSMVEIVISFVIGLLPGLDNFSHIGGFIMGLLMGTALMQSPRSLRKRQRDHLRKKRAMLEAKRRQQSSSSTTNKHNNNKNEIDDDIVFEDSGISLTTFNDNTRHRENRHYLDDEESSSSSSTDKKNMTRVKTNEISSSSSSNGSSSSNLRAERLNSDLPQRPDEESPFSDEYDVDLVTAQNTEMNRRVTRRGINLRSSKPSSMPSKHSLRSKSRSWYTWAGVRLLCLALVIAFYVGLIINFKNGGGNCSWCKYLSCLPVNGWCDVGDITTTTTTSSSSSSSSSPPHFLVKKSLDFISSFETNYSGTISITTLTLFGYSMLFIIRIVFKSAITRKLK